MTASFHILFNSLFTSYPIIQRYMSAVSNLQAACGSKNILPATFIYTHFLKFIFYDELYEIR
jgi:hypothetical protein